MKSVAITISAFLFALLAACQSGGQEPLRSETGQAPTANRDAAGVSQPAKRNSAKLIHVLVALCDNEFQGIVPVPARIGNGDDPANNLYWGARFGVKTFFKRAGDWKLVAGARNPRAEILERLVFKHQTKNVYLVADAYRGREIKRCVADFFEFSAGRASETINANSIELYAGGGADLVAYVGHDGLMDFSLDSYPQKADDRQRDAVMLACASKRYFAEPLRKTGARPLLWTTGLMAPEAYVLKAAIDGWVLNEDGEETRRRAATAYNQYQRCGMNAAMKLFSTGW
ncbi:MAG: hypothetical protein MOB07_11650 [Acidobacteria bacterium]|nr:hypothetical protein [Acidobacteriota bacterium]